MQYTPHPKLDISTHILTLLTQITNKTFQLLAINSVLLWIYKSYMAYNILKWLLTKSQAPWKFNQIRIQQCPSQIVILRRIRIVTNDLAHSNCYHWLPMIAMISMMIGLFVCIRKSCLGNVKYRRKVKYFFGGVYCISTRLTNYDFWWRRLTD